MGHPTSLDEALGAMGFKVEDPDAEVDIPQESGDDQGVPDEPPPWSYRYYLQGLFHWQQPAGATEILRAWQQALVTECQLQGLSIKFAVGFTALSETAEFLSVGGVRVALVSTTTLHDSTTLTELAKLVVHTLH